MVSNSVHVVIPARFGSSRLPGKPLADINGKPMIQHVYERASRHYDDVTVATDDERIAEVVASFGGKVIMTSAEHESGTDRLAEVARNCSWPKEDIIINWQGDEPALPTQCVEAVLSSLQENPVLDIATAVVRLTDWEEFCNPDVVKAVLSDQCEALYFSRAPIPYLRGKVGVVPSGAFRHIGLYGYRVGAVMAMADAATSGDSETLEHCEKLEQLRALSAGMKIGCAVLPFTPPHGVDTPQDLELMRVLIGGGSHE